MYMLLLNAYDGLNLVMVVSPPTLISTKFELGDDGGDSY